MTNVLRHKLLTAEEEKTLGATIQIGQAAARQLAAADAPSRRTRREPLTAARRAELERLAAAGKTARDEMVTSNLKLVVSVGRRLGFIRPGATADDIDVVVQAGAIGLCRAADAFQPDRGAKFSTYATWWIRKALTEEFSHMADRPGQRTEARESAVWVRKAEDDVVALKHRPATDGELAAATGISATTIHQWRIAGPASLEALAAGGGERHIAESPAVDQSTEESAIDHVLDTAVAEHLRGALAQLPDKQRRIVEARFGFDASGAPKTIAECAKALGIATCTASQLLAAAMKSLEALVDSDVCQPH